MPDNKNTEPRRLPWRKAVKKTMQQATEQEIIYRFGSVDNASFNYRWEHVQSVVTLATRLGELTGADLEVVEAAAWLHDVRKDAGDSHPRQGAKFAREFLPQTTFPPEKIERVAQAIEDHMGLW
ncbi:MAG: HD domain-containing protein, partial [Candidatus Promineifilaceae bacterium]